MADKKPNRERNKGMTIFLSEEEKRLMESLTEKTGKSKSDLVRDFIVRQGDCSNNNSKPAQQSGG